MMDIKNAGFPRDGPVLRALDQESSTMYNLAILVII